MTAWLSIALGVWFTASLPISVVLGTSIRRSDGRPRSHRSDRV